MSVRSPSAGRSSARTGTLRTVTVGRGDWKRAKSPSSSIVSPLADPTLARYENGLFLKKNPSKFFLLHRLQLQETASDPVGVEDPEMPLPGIGLQETKEPPLPVASLPPPHHSLPEPNVLVPPPSSTSSSTVVDGLQDELTKNLVAARMMNVRNFLSLFYTYR